MIWTVIIVGVIVILLVGLGIGILIEWIPLGILGAICAAIVYGLVVWGLSIGYSNPRDLTCTVTSTDRAKSDGGSDARVYTKECGVLNVQDMFWGRQFNSADVFAAIEPGHKYKFHVTGVRWPFWSIFPHIRSVEKV